MIFLWTPPHYWPLSMKYKDDYAAVDVPMLGASCAAARRSGCRSSCTRGRPWRARCCSSPSRAWACVYTAVALVFGGWFIYEIAPPVQPRDPARGGLADARLPRARSRYLTLLFVAIGIDPLLPF